MTKSPSPPSAISAASAAASSAGTSISSALSSAATSASSSITSASASIFSTIQDAAATSSSPTPSSSLTSAAASAASASASATASTLASSSSSAADDGLSHLSRFGITMAVLVTVLAVVAAGVYFAGYADDVGRWAAKKYYVGKARAEVEAMGKVGGGAAQGFLKDSLKKNPVMGEDELDQVVPGLGGEAVQDGLAGVSGKLGGLGKL